MSKPTCWGKSPNTNSKLYGYLSQCQTRVNFNIIKKLQFNPTFTTPAAK